MYPSVLYRAIIDTGLRYCPNSTLCIAMHWFEIYLKKYIYYTEMKQIWHKQHTSKALSSVEQHFPSWGQETAARRDAWADGLYLLLATVAGQGSTQHLHLPHGNLVCIPPRASHASHMSISLITGRLSPPFLRKKRLRCFLLHIAAEPVNTALLQQLWQLSLDIVHIQEYLGCVRSCKNRVETFVTKV